MQPPKNTPSALLPLLLFLVLFNGTGIWLTYMGMEMAFYQLSAAVAIIPAIVLAMWQGKEKLQTKIDIFLTGIGDINIITMCMIYLLAGAFASVATAIGGVSATVNMGLSLVPPQFILPGMFCIAAFVSTAMGTSMGTIAAIAPIALGVADQTGMNLSLLIGVVVGGAMFGDNLSIISDTTIAATRTQGCEMRDKFVMNFFIALPTALLVLVLLWLKGEPATVQYGDYQFIKVLPYLLVLVLAVAGVNVFVVLLSGILVSGAVGIFFADYSALTWCQDIFKGFTNMNEIMVLSMCIGGLGELIRFHGGINWLLGKVDNLARRIAGGVSRKAGELCIALLAGLADICTANNTVAIILTGGMAKDIAEKNGIEPRRSASILDITSCVMQGLLPYAAQLLLAGSIAKISPMEIAMDNWYCMLLGIAMAIAIAFGLPKPRTPKNKRV